MFKVPLIILLLSSLLQLVFSDRNNNIPLPHPRNIAKKEINCTNDIICNISLVVAPMMSMTYYNITNAHAYLRGYRAYYHQISEIDYELDFFDRSKNTNISRSMLKEPITVDGEFRSIITINYQMPGPTIIVNENQELNITVYNDLLNGEGISIHWHGMHQKGKYDMDGVAHITQEPIPAHKSFTYNFTASPAGTHWYHAHSGTHRTEGLYGALIVKDAYQKELYDEDQPQNHTLLLMDWQKEASIDLFNQIRSSLGFTKTTYACKTQPTTRDPSYCYCDASREKEEYQNYSEPKSVDYTQVGPIPFWSGIINDKGRHYDEQGRHNGADLNVFTVTHGKRYRFRLIGAQALYAYKFSIQDHVLTVIATDGNPIESIKDVHYVIVNSGERYDIVVNANQNQTRNYWILAETLENPINDMGNLNEGFHNRVQFHRAEAVLHYENASDPKTFYQTKPVMTWDNTCIRNYVNCPFSTEEQLLPVPLPASPTMNCTNVDQFVSIDDITPEIYEPSITMFYNFGFDGENTSNGSSVDGINFRLPANLPNTQEFDSTNQACTGRGCDHNNFGHCACTQVINITQVEKGQCVQLVVTNHFGKNGNNRNPESSHPIHLHGHTFYVVKIGYPSYDTSDSSLLKRKYYDQNKDVTCRKIPDDNTHNSTCEWFITVDRDGQRVQEVMWANNTAPDFESKAYAAKDTVIVPFGGYVVIRFIANNSGWWFFHCHIEIHQLEGMAALIQELDPQSTTPESDKALHSNVRSSGYNVLHHSNFHFCIWLFLYVLLVATH